MALGPAQGRACDKSKVFWKGPTHENRLFIENRCFRSFLVHFGPSRPQKWIRLEISVILVVSRGLYDENKSIS